MSATVTVKTFGFQSAVKKRNTFAAGKVFFLFAIKVYRKGDFSLMIWMWNKLEL